MNRYLCGSLYLLIVYADEEERPRHKAWLLLDFSSFGQFCYMPFTNFDQASAEDTLKKIHFNLLIKFGEDHETPPDKNFLAQPNEGELFSDYIIRLQNSCSINYFDYQIIYERKQRERVRIFEQFQADGDFSEKQIFNAEDFKEIDCYYSNDSSSNQEQQDGAKPQQDGATPRHHGKKAKHIKSRNKPVMSNCIIHDISRKRTKSQNILLFSTPKLDFQLKILCNAFYLCIIEY